MALGESNDFVCVPSIGQLAFKRYSGSVYIPANQNLKGIKF